MGVGQIHLARHLMQIGQWKRFAQGGGGRAKRDNGRIRIELAGKRRDGRFSGKCFRISGFDSVCGVQ